MGLLRVGVHEGGRGQVCSCFPPAGFFFSECSDVPDRREAMNNRSKKGVAISFHTLLLSITRLIRRLAID